MTKTQEMLILKGLSACGGEAVGKAKIALSPPQGYAKLENGDILVIKYTTPEWFPLCVIAGAIIGEVGGVCSHLAVLARELNKPTVVAVRDATTLINDGDLLRVDATRGEIYKFCE